MVDVLGVGDVMLGDTHHRWGAGIGTRIRNGAGGILEIPGGVSADVSVFNLEAPVVPGRFGAMPFAVRRESLSRLAPLPGTRIASVANNHMGEFGRKGVEHTVKVLLEEGFEVAGAKLGGRPFCTEVAPGGRPLRVAAYSLIDGFGADYIYAGGEEELLSLVSKSLSGDVPLVLSLHWGREYGLHPLKRQVVLAEKLFALGCRAILGHHSHVVQPVWEADEGFAAFSLGNFVFDMVWSGELRRGIGVVVAVGGGTARLENLFIQTRALSLEVEEMCLLGRERALEEFGFDGRLEDDLRSADAVERVSRKAGRRFLLERLAKGEAAFALRYALWRVRRSCFWNEEKGYWR